MGSFLNSYIVLSGLPASGKSSLGGLLSSSLDIPLIDQDHYLEGLFESMGTGDLAWRKQLSDKADIMFRQAAMQSPGAIITAWWHHPKSPSLMGTPTEWLNNLPGKILEVHCACRPETAAQRFLFRKRHPGHLDQKLSHSYLVSAFKDQAMLGPLGVGTLLTVNTEVPVDFAQLLEAVNQALA